MRALTFYLYSESEVQYAFVLLKMLRCCAYFTVETKEQGLQSAAHALFNLLAGVLSEEQFAQRHFNLHISGAPYTSLSRPLFITNGLGEPELEIKNWIFHVGKKFCPSFWRRIEKNCWALKLPPQSERASYQSEKKMNCTAPRSPHNVFLVAARASALFGAYIKSSLLIHLWTIHLPPCDSYNISLVYVVYYRLLLVTTIKGKRRRQQRNQ